MEIYYTIRIFFADKAIKYFLLTYTYTQLNNIVDVGMKYST